MVQFAVDGVEGAIRTVGTLEVGADSSVELRASWIDESNTLHRRGTVALREPRILAGDGVLVGAYASSIRISLDGLCEATFRCSRLIRGSFGVSPEQLEHASTTLWAASFVGWKDWAQVQFGDPFRLGDQPFDAPEALDDLVTTLGVGDKTDEIGDRMIEARHYVLHMASARREAADAYRTLHSESMVIYADVLAAIAYNDVLSLLGFIHREERADIVGRAMGFARSYFGRSTPRA